MQELTIKFIEKSEVAENTYKYTFEKPGEFTFIAGQYVIIEPDDRAFADERQPFRTFTISSAPHEDHLAFVMRHSESAFKKNLHALEAGDTVTIKGALGHMRLPDDVKVPVVFLCAGVGITPARSMLLNAAHRKSRRKFLLINSNREACSTPCMDEVMSFDLDNYEVINVMGKECDKWQEKNGKKWDGPIGRVDTRLIKKYTQDLDDPTYYIVGTTGYVGAMRSCLEELEIPKEKIIIDNFG